MSPPGRSGRAPPHLRTQLERAVRAVCDAALAFDQHRDSATAGAVSRGWQRVYFLLQFVPDEAPAEEEPDGGDDNGVGGGAAAPGGGGAA